MKGKTITEYTGNEANFFRKKWARLSLDDENWTAVYFDEISGNHWLLDFISPESHGGGIPRLRLMDEAMKTEFLSQ